MTDLNVKLDFDNNLFDWGMGKLHLTRKKYLWNSTIFAEDASYYFAKAMAPILSNLSATRILMHQVCRTEIPSKLYVVLFWFKHMVCRTSNYLFIFDCLIVKGV